MTNLQSGYICLKRMRTAVYLVLFLAVLAGYFLHTPVPEDLADPFYFRLVIASVKVGAIATTLGSLVLPKDEAFVFTHRVLTEVALPSPDRHVPGSNVTARYTDFDGVRVLLYEPTNRGAQPTPGFVFIHGGGFITGSTKLHGPLTRKLAEALNVVLVSVEYRLSPEVLYPAQTSDCLTATRFFLQHASVYGVDPHRVVISGDSAGGHIAAVVAQYIREEHTLPDIKLQVHFYPIIQAFDLNTPSHQCYESTFGDLGISKAWATYFMSLSYLGRLDSNFMADLIGNRHISNEFRRSQRYRKIFGHDIIFQKVGATPLSSSTPPSTSCPFASPNRTGYKPLEEFEDVNETLWMELRDFFLGPDMSPLLVEDLGGLPKAFVATGDRDIVRDDGIFLVHALEQAGVEVTWKNYPGAWHGIVAAGPLVNIPTGVRILEDAIDFVKRNV